MKKKTPIVNKSSKPIIKIDLINQTRHTHLPTKKLFLSWVEKALVHPAALNELTICIVDPTQSADLNKRFRHKEGPTNVLSFETIPIPGELTHSLGDLVICAKLVSEEAKLAKKKVLSHWAHLTIHGTLHLQGYDHQKIQEAQIMEKLESKIMKKLGFPNPYSFNGSDHESKKS